MQVGISLTFHAVRYLPHLVRHWPTLIDTLLGLGNSTYPGGWLDVGGAMSDHNNYDVVELLRRGWRFMRPDQRVSGSKLIGTMLEWCLSKSVSQKGEVLAPDTSEMIPDAYYFASAFLDTIGFFEPRKRFWTDREFDHDPIRTGLAKQLGAFNPGLDVVTDTLERLEAAMD